MISLSWSPQKTGLCLFSNPILHFKNTYALVHHVKHIQLCAGQNEDPMLLRRKGKYGAKFIINIYLDHKKPVMCISSYLKIKLFKRYQKQHVAFFSTKTISQQCYLGPNTWCRYCCLMTKYNCAVFTFENGLTLIVLFSIV